MDRKLPGLLARRRLLMIPAVAAVALACAACGSSSTTTTSKKTSSSSSSSSGISSSELSRLKSMIAQAQAPPVWTAPGPAVNGSVVKGKTLVVFPISSDIPACATQAKDFAALAKTLGANVISPSSTTGPAGWASNLGDAISDHAAAAVMLCGVINAAVAPQLAALKSHGIPVVDGNYNEAPTSKFYAGIQGETAVNTAQGVEDDLADALVNLDGKPAHILYVTSSQVIQDAGVGSPSTDTAGAYPALKAAINKWCPGKCSIVRIDNLQTTQWTSDGSGVASYLSSNPSINAVIVAFDGESDNLVTEVNAAAASHPGLKIYAWGGGAAEERDVQSQPVFAADSGPDERWDAYDAMDQVIRLLNHKPAASVSKEVDPNVFFTKSNIASFFAGPGPTYSDKAFGNGAFITDFDRLWGVS
jgi:hypothetical protein